MQQDGYTFDSSAAIAQYFSKAALPTQQETLGEIVVEILDLDPPFPDSFCILS